MGLAMGLAVGLAVETRQVCPVLLKVSAPCERLVNVLAPPSGERCAHTLHVLQKTSGHSQTLWSLSPLWNSAKSPWCRGRALTVQSDDFGKLTTHPKPVS